MLPIVTVIIPARNEAAVIEAAIASVLAQDHPLDRVELIVVDGASEDDTKDVAKRALDGCGLRRWAVEECLERRTPANLNHGLAWAEGDIVVRVDARSRIPSHYVRETIRVLGDPGVAVTGGSQRAVPRAETAKARGIARALNHPYGMGLSRYRRKGAPSGPTDTVYLGAFRAEQLRSAGGWSTAFSTNQDFELNRRMARFGHVWFHAGLEVSYLGREHLSELARQYFRFGTWKAHYWRTTGDRPRPRQLVLLASVPAAVGLGGVVLGVLGAPALVLVPVGLVVVDAFGDRSESADITTRAVSVVALTATSLGWWLGCCAGLIGRARVR